MGNHYSCRNINKGSSSLNENTNMKIKLSAKQPVFLNPENLVLPIVPNGPQALRSTGNGSILQNGGTISGRKNEHASHFRRSPEFVLYFQNRSQANRSFAHADSFPQSLLGNKKSHSDPDIARKVLKETEDSDGALKPEFNHRSRIALSPSKAKIRSRKKKKAPDPPNTLPRSGRRPSAHVIEQDHLKARKRPLPPIPPDYLPPSPNIDYSRAAPEKCKHESSSENRHIENLHSKTYAAEYLQPRQEFSKLTLERALLVCSPSPPDSVDASCSSSNHSASIPTSNGQCFQNRVDQRKCIKPDGCFENRKATSLEKLEILNRRESEERLKSQILHTGNSYRHLNTNAPMTTSSENFRVPNYSTKRISTVQGVVERMNRNPSFKSSLNLSDDEAPKTNKYKSNRPYRCNALRDGHRANEIALESLKQHHSATERKLKGRKPPPLTTYSAYISSEIEKPKLAYKCASTEDSFEQYAEKQKGYILPEREGYETNNRHFIARENVNSSSNAKNISERSRENHLQQNSRVRPPDGNVCDANKLSKHGDATFSDGKGNSKDFTGEPGGNTVAGCLLCNKKIMHQDCLNISVSDEGFGEPKKPIKFERNECLSNNSIKASASTKEYQLLSKTEILREYSENTSRLQYELFSELRKASPVVTVLPNSRISISSNSDDELDIKLELRPTLPRRPINKLRFSPIDVWKSISLDLFQENSRSDNSTDEGDEILEDEIQRIQKTVAPKRVDKSGDSGISQGAVTSPVDDWTPGKDFSSAHQVTRTVWTPQQDMEESDGERLESAKVCNQRESKLASHAQSLQPTFAMPNLMFPSKSFPRTNPKKSTDAKDTLQRVKGRLKGRRKRSHRNSETQHFNSLRSLKRVLGIRTSEANAQKIDCWDSNWSLTRSLPNIEVSNPREYELETRESGLDSSGEKMRHVLGPSVVHEESHTNYFVRDSHVMYLPEYDSAIAPNYLNGLAKNIHSLGQANVRENPSVSQQVSSNETTNKQNKFKNMFSYQSTLRKLEKKKLEEKLAREVEFKEKKREKEIEWMNMVEEEFRKQRSTEKSELRNRLRKWSLQEEKKKSEIGSSESNEDENEIHNLLHGHVYLPGPLNGQNATEQNVEVSNPRTSDKFSPLTLKSIGLDEESTKAQDRNGCKINQHSPERFPLAAHNQNTSQTSAFQGRKEENQKEFIPFQDSVDSVQSSYNFRNGCTHKTSKVQSLVSGNGLRGNKPGERVTSEQDAAQVNHLEREERMQLRTRNMAVPDFKGILNGMNKKKHLEECIYTPRRFSGEGKENEPNQGDGMQPTGMKKWLRQPSRNTTYRESIPRPEPEGRRSPRVHEAVHNHAQDEKQNLRCCHGNMYPCRTCFLYESQCRHFAREGASGRLKRFKAEVNKEIYAKVQKNDNAETTSDVSAKSVLSTGKHQFEENPCQGNKRQAFQPYGLKDNSELESTRKSDAMDSNSRSIFLPDFRNESEENGRQMPMVKNSLNIQLNDSDSDSNHSDIKGTHFRRHLTKIQKKKSDQRHPSFTRNHPLRRVKYQASTYSVPKT